MNYILLSGGSGKRLWPLSNSSRSKQFIKFFENEQGEPESMIQRVHRQIHKADPEASVLIATSESQVPIIHNQLGDDVNLSVEPIRRDTFPAIALAVAYAVDVLHYSRKEPLIVCPVDPYVDDSYFNCLLKMGELVKERNGGLVLMGIQPTYPSEKYGYIIPTDNHPVSAVSKFAEKPDLKTAENYLKQNALWNGGVFAFLPDYLLPKIAESFGTCIYLELLNNYSSLQTISFDYGFVEKESDIAVLRYNGKWSDVGTWNTLTESLNKDIIGKGVKDKKSTGVSIVNELDIPILTMGLKDVVIATSPDGILVADKNESSYMKPYVDGFTETAMYAEKSWGSYQIINIEQGSLTLKVTLNPGHRMHYHAHQKRDEVWVVIEGEGVTRIDGIIQDVRTGDVITMQAGCKHTISAKTRIKLIEVQIGEAISVGDKVQYD